MEGLAQIWKTRLPKANVSFVSALTGDGISDLVNSFTQYLPEVINSFVLIFSCAHISKYIG